VLREEIGRCPRGSAPGEPAPHRLDVSGQNAVLGIATGRLLAKLLTPDELKLYRAEKAPAPPASSDNGRPARETRRAPTGNAVIVSGVGDMLVRFARCCSPLPGEEIIGFITRGRGVTVHLKGCPHAMVSDPQRRVPVVWKEGEDSPRPIRLEVLSIDQPGLLAAMSKTIASAGVNISTAEVKATGNDGRALSVFELSVGSARQLNCSIQWQTLQGLVKEPATPIDWSRNQSGQFDRFNHPGFPFLANA